LGETISVCIAVIGNKNVTAAVAKCCTEYRIVFVCPLLLPPSARISAAGRCADSSNSSNIMWINLSRLITSEH
jgi:hypothetical protein